MKHDLNRARKCVEMLDQRRLERALLGSGDGFQQVLSLLPLLFQLNHPSLPGYVMKAPCGVAHFSLSDYQQRFRNDRYADPITNENSGSAQYMLLDEFYRSAVRLAGNPLLWLHFWVEKETDYESEVQKSVENGEINPQDWVDFGGLGQFSANEYFGASLWQLYKGIDSRFYTV